MSNDVAKAQIIASLRNEHPQSRDHLFSSVRAMHDPKINSREEFDIIIKEMFDTSMIIECSPPGPIDLGPDPVTVDLTWIDLPPPNA